MCSGCSGNYAGDFEEFGDPGGPWDEAESFTAEDWGSTQGRGSDESAAGVCEILVSATRIIEIRMIAADRREINELPRGEAAETPHNQHSRAESAKYYQTRTEHAKKSGDRVEMRSSRGISCFFPAEFGIAKRLLTCCIHLVRTKNGRGAKGERRRGDGIARA